MSEAQVREFTKWPVLGQNIWRETYGYQQRNTYQKEVGYLKSFLAQRWAWMDTELAKVSNPFTTVPSLLSGLKDGKIEVYPNPVKDHLVFSINCARECKAVVQIYDPVGKPVQNSGPYFLNSGKNSIKLEMDGNMNPGVYFFRIMIGNKPAGAGRFVKKGF